MIFFSLWWAQSDEIIILNLIAAGKKEDTHWTAGEPSWHQCQQRLRQTQSLMRGRMEPPLHLTKRAKQALQYQFKYSWTTVNSSYTSVDLLFCLKESITSPFLYCSSITTVWSERLILCDVCVYVWVCNPFFLTNYSDISSHKVWLQNIQYFTRYGPNSSFEKMTPHCDLDNRRPIFCHDPLVPMMHPTFKVLLQVVQNFRRYYWDKKILWQKRCQPLITRYNK